MNPESILACYFVCTAGVDQEDGWIEEALARIKTYINRAEWDKARAACERFVVDVEGHFAFEELVINRTGFGCGRDHRLSHAAGLSVIRNLLRELLAGGAPPVACGGTKSLLASLLAFEEQAKAHVCQYHQSLCLHAGRLAGVPHSHLACG